MKLNFPEHLSTADLIKYFWTLKIASSIYQIFLNVLNALWYREPYLQCYDTIKIFTYQKDECYYFGFLYLLLLFQEHTHVSKLFVANCWHFAAWQFNFYFGLESFFSWSLGKCTLWFIHFGNHSGVKRGLQDEVHSSHT